jgi:hypothetical protein
LRLVGVVDELFGLSVPFRGLIRAHPR